MVRRDLSHLPKWPGWHLLGSFSTDGVGDPDGVGSWILHHNGEGMLLEIPPGLTVEIVEKGLRELGVTLEFVTASHTHEDHLDADVWENLWRAYPKATFINPSMYRNETLINLGGETVYYLPVMKHSRSDVVFIFRGVAMAGDIELGQLKSVNREVPAVATRWASMQYLKDYPRKIGYNVHSIVSAHLNDVRENVDWPSLFTV